MIVVHYFTEDEIIGDLKGENTKFYFGNNKTWQTLPMVALDGDTLKTSGNEIETFVRRK